jgi:hypothetical protein
MKKIFIIIVLIFVHSFVWAEEGLTEEQLTEIMATRVAASGLYINDEVRSDKYVELFAKSLVQNLLGNFLNEIGRTGLYHKDIHSDLQTYLNVNVMSVGKFPITIPANIKFTGNTLIDVLNEVADTLFNMNEKKITELISLKNKNEYIKFANRNSLPAWSVLLIVGNVHKLKKNPQTKSKKLNQGLSRSIAQETILELINILRNEARPAVFGTFLAAELLVRNPKLERPQVRRVNNSTLEFLSIVDGELRSTTVESINSSSSVCKKIFAH